MDIVDDMRAAPAADVLEARARAAGRQGIVLGKGSNSSPPRVRGPLKSSDMSTIFRSRN